VHIAFDLKGPANDPKNIGIRIWSDPEGFVGEPGELFTYALKMSVQKMNQQNGSSILQCLTVIFVLDNPYFLAAHVNQDDFRRALLFKMHDTKAKDDLYSPEEKENFRFNYYIFNEVRARYLQKNLPNDFLTRPVAEGEYRFAKSHAKLLD
jgi:hypothetical protein